MNKELGRKITSLTLMTIMLTWSAAMGFSSTFMPEAEAAGNTHLWVSAEDFGSFAGPQVIEIVVTEPNISEIDTAYGMPDVTIDGNKIIMAQGIDGSWYAYVVQADASNALDSYYIEANTGAGSGADFGRRCGPTTDIAGAGVGETTSALTPDGTVGIWVPNRLGGESSGSIQGTTGYSAGDAITVCTITDVEHSAGVATGVNATSTLLNNVVREFTP